jgi:hypothetical protein
MRSSHELRQFVRQSAAKRRVGLRAGINDVNLVDGAFSPLRGWLASLRG